ncbi:MAG: YbbR-like domain-containing protein [Fimbriimonadaceae bacterium]
MKENALLFTVSLFIAVLLWFIAQPIVTESIIKSLEVEIEPRNVPENLELIDHTSEVEVVVEGTRDEIDSLGDDDLIAFIDLSNANAGTESAEIELEVPDRYLDFLTLEVRVARVVLEELSTKEIPVTVEPTGSPPPQFTYTDSTIVPAEVTVEGAASSVQATQRARVVIDLSLLRPNALFQPEVELLDENNRPVVNVRPVPPRVEVRPGVEVSQPNRIVTVFPQFQGLPPVGYRLDNYEITPSQVEVVGPTEIVNDLGSVPTQAIDLSELRQSTTVEVPLELPSGVMLAQDVVVSVRLQIRRDN